MPLLEDAEAVRQVAHRVDGEDGIEALVLEREAPAGVDSHEADPVVESARLSQLRRGRYALLEDVDADDVCAGRFREAERRPAGSTAHIEQARSGLQLEPFAEALELVHGQPAGLAQVVTVGLAANSLAHPEAGIGRGVEAHLLPHTRLG